MICWFEPTVCLRTRGASQRLHGSNLQLAQGLSLRLHRSLGAGGLRLRQGVRDLDLPLSLGRFFCRFRSPLGFGLNTLPRYGEGSCLCRGVSPGFGQGIGPGLGGGFSPCPRQSIGPCLGGYGRGLERSQCMNRHGEACRGDRRAHRQNRKNALHLDLPTAWVRCHRQHLNLSVNIRRRSGLHRRSSRFAYGIFPQLLHRQQVPGKKS
jgi:hypothetical protein